MNYRNPKYNHRGTITVEIEHPEYGWIPFTCDPEDTGALFDTAAVFAELAPIAAPYVAPEPPTAEELLDEERAFMVCSPAQMRLTLLEHGLLETVDAIVSANPAAQIVWEYANTIERKSPLIDALGGPNGFSPEAIDELFREAMSKRVG